jgi:hypothetical protein
MPELTFRMDKLRQNGGVGFHERASLETLSGDDWTLPDGRAGVLWAAFQP